MINLISTEEKQKRVRDFYLRLAVVFFTGLGFCLLVALFSILPAYFISIVNKNVVNEKLAAQKLEPLPLVDQSSLAIIESVKNKISLIENAEKNKYPISQKIINEIMLAKMGDIKINQISYENVAGNKKINVRGIAPSRERLLLFREALEGDKNFKKVDLPISNFVKGSDIDFNLSITPI